ncbi:isoprenyl transferase [Deferribacter autotrophicus]|uniref:Isoprenyl transferase n=1 Tax=Deferribacter autotrophicus TaxID=500465 RepID=A0A5A8F101_9BACT|nr:isoprenyl transferase [Deferribacter autotrophicus]KAA0257748.1 isoprenyl transferase [Deferribacter autotrophicus]
MEQRNIPAHVAIIMDGNGRWAKKRGLPRIFGHRAGVQAVEKIVSHASNLGVKYLSLFAFSTENWLRPEDEVSGLMTLLSEFVDKKFSDIIEKNIKFIVSGRLMELPDEPRSKVLKLIETSKNNTGMVLNLALNYGGRKEIVDAINKILDSGIKEIDEKIFSDFLYSPEVPDIDLLIRTSGEMRISNFMLWRLAYAELYFTKTLWPDFDEKEFDKAILDYQKRDRRFGMTDEQIKRGKI